MRFRLLMVFFGLVVVIAAWFAVRAFQERRFQHELLQARGDFARRRFGAARARLAELARRRPGEGEVEYLLGVCEKLQGHPDAAMSAWLRVADGSDQAPLAALSHGRLALELGRYRLAEGSLLRASGAKGEVSDEAGRLLEWLYWMTGRRDENRGVLHRRVERAADPSLTLRALWSADHDPYPVDGIRDALTKARGAAPDDDCVWFGLADLAMRSGRLDEAGEWLTRCERARPDDPEVWRARLRWAKAAGRPDQVRRVIASQPAASVPQTTMLALRAWLERQAGDTRAERSSLEALIALQPADDAALERLADLAAQAGEPGRVADLRRSKAAIDAARDHYRALINLPDMAPHAAEFARAAEAIGRWFDAKAWWTLAVRRDPSLTVEGNTAMARIDKAQRASEAQVTDLARALGQVPLNPTRTVAQPSELSIPTFIDDAERRGLTFSFDNGCTDLRQLPETMSGGVAVLDFDGDGWLDVYAIQGGPFPPPKQKPPFGDRLFRNRGDGRFDDVTATSGLALLEGGYGHGVAVGDYDNDGRPDLFVTRWGSYALYHNLGGVEFEDVTARVGLGGNRDWPTSAAWADLDNDGDLDLYVCHYLKWDAENPTLCEYAGHSKPGYTHCDPSGLPALPDHVFRNDGGRFVDVTDEGGIVDRNGRGLGVVAADLDGDGKTDLFVANDTTANDFFHNFGGFRFVERGTESGLAASAAGGYLAGMGVAYGDFDGDARLDLAVTNFFNQSTTLYHNHGGGVFSDRSAATGLAASTLQVLGFGLAALDANNDGWLDLVQANGHVTDNRPSIPREMKAQLLLGDGAGNLVDVSDRAGPPWQVPRLGRGLAIGDMDNDGRIDVLLVSQNAPLGLFHNRPAVTNHDRAESRGRFLMLALEGTKSNRDGVGAVVAVTVSGRSQVKARFGGGSYLSASDHRLHFGLGTASLVDRVEVTWPSGRHDVYSGLAAGAGYRLREGDPTPRPLAGFSAAR